MLNSGINVLFEGSNFERLLGDYSLRWRLRYFPLLSVLY